MKNDKRKQLIEIQKNIIATEEDLEHMAYLNNRLREYKELEQKLLKELIEEGDFIHEWT